jgi:hypothetical protein
MEEGMAQGHALQMISPGGENTEAPVLSSQDAGAGNVDKIRDILFGSQMREYEGRFARLEDNVAKELADLRDAAKKRADAIEGYARGEFEALQARLRNERDDRTAGLRQVARDLNELSSAITKKIEDVDEQAVQAHRQLRIELLELSKTFTEDLASKQEQMSALVDKRFHELRKGKTDRAALATLLNEMSLKLSGELAKTASDA